MLRTFAEASAESERETNETAHAVAALQRNCRAVLVVVLHIEGIKCGIHDSVRQRQLKSIGILPKCASRGVYVMLVE